MTLWTLDLTDFRCIQSAELELDPHCTLIVGDNGSGKSSLLEAVHVLSCGRSFRTSHSELLVRAHQPGFLIRGAVTRNGGRTLLGVKGFAGRVEPHFDGRKSAGFAELARALPVQVIDPHVHQLVDGGPKERRRFLDWGVFHVEPRFVGAWRRFQTALRQRNAALKARSDSGVVRSWDEEFCAAGSLVAAFRKAYLEDLQEHVGLIANALLGLPVTLSFRQGWDETVTLDTALVNSWARDAALGQTSIGPHRADVVISVDDSIARERVSRGQQKLLASAAILGQLVHQAAHGLGPAVLLFDDPAAELDVENLKRLLTVIVQIPAQLMVTALDDRSFEGLSGGKKFHVKQGRVDGML